MKLQVFAALFVSGLFLVLLGGCRSASLEGHWEGGWGPTDDPNLKYVEEFSLDLTVSENSVTGFGVDEEGVAAKVVGTVEGRSFELLVTPEDGSSPVTFSGYLTGRRVEGKWSVKMMSGTWSAERTGIAEQLNPPDQE